MPSNGTRPGSKTKVRDVFGVELPIVDWAKEEGIAEEQMKERISEAVQSPRRRTAANFGPDLMRYIEKALLLQILDQDWREHIIQLEHLRQYVGLRGYGQRDPLNEYKSEALTLFENLLVRLRTDVVRHVMHVQIRQGEPPPVQEPPLPRWKVTTSIRSPAKMRWHRPPPFPRAEFVCASPRRRLIRTIREPGAKSAAMQPAPAGLARSSSTVTARSCKAPPYCGSSVLSIRQDNAGFCCTPPSIARGNFQDFC
jgi:hypothetical protein